MTIENSRSSSLQQPFYLTQGRVISSELKRTPIFNQQTNILEQTETKKPVLLQSNTDGIFFRPTSLTLSQIRTE